VSHAEVACAPKKDRVAVRLAVKPSRHREK
jgi:hypothetical protein